MQTGPQPVDLWTRWPSTSTENLIAMASILSGPGSLRDSVTRSGCHATGTPEEPPRSGPNRHQPPRPCQSGTKTHPIIGSDVGLHTHKTRFLTIRSDVVIFLKITWNKQHFPEADTPSEFMSIDLVRMLLRSQDRRRKLKADRDGTTW